MHGGLLPGHLKGPGTDLEDRSGDETDRDRHMLFAPPYTEEPNTSHSRKRGGGGDRLPGLGECERGEVGPRASSSSSRSGDAVGDVVTAVSNVVSQTWKLLRE